MRHCPLKREKANQPAASNEFEHSQSKLKWEWKWEWDWDQDWVRVWAWTRVVGKLRAAGKQNQRLFSHTRDIWAAY